MLNRARKTDAHNIIHRVFLLANRDPAETTRILKTAPAGGGPSAIAALRAGNPDKAYLAAIDVMRPRRAGMLVGGRPRRPGATSALHE
jgi:hypothetical protein